ncbi:MAG: galactokinase [Ruminococcaceae bacterium]|nr:galactokinase [Oscillospiraceae bacterium]
MLDKNGLIAKFIEIYGGDASDVRIFSSPGRVNLIGEHTDYNGGFVFPAALSQCSTVAVRKTDSGLIRVAATDLPDRVSLDITKLGEYKDISWGNYQAGVAYVMQQAGYNIQSCDILYHDTVPFGAGLSSSAAIEVVMSLVLATFSYENGATDKPNMIELAKISQKAENTYCGVNCGIMDQFASAMGRKNHAIFLDCKDLSFKYVPLELKGYKVVIGNTNKKRSLAESKYNERRAQCEEALEQLKLAYPEAECLRDITAEQFENGKTLILDDLCRMRAEHVVYECDRVLKSVEALAEGDLRAFGSLMTASHISLRDLYEVTGTHLDVMVEESLKIEGCIGSRMTGAGFGGCTVSIVADSAVETFISEVGKNYEERTGIAPSFYVSEVGDGGREIL